MDEAKVIAPGDREHPAEQVRRAGEPIAGVYGGRIVLYGDIEPRTIGELEVEIEGALGKLTGGAVNVSLTRTDR